jgi:type VI protein secretion system component Hcp
MKLKLVSIVFLLTTCGAARAATNGVIVVTWSATTTPGPCAPAGITLGALPACPANTSFQAQSISLGGERGSLTGPASFTDIALSKTTDASSSALFLSMLEGKPLGNVLISVYTPNDIAVAGTGTPIASYTLTLTGSPVTSIADSASSTIPEQSVTLSYATINYSYIVHNASGTQDSLAFTYNHLTGTFR